MSWLLTGRRVLVREHGPDVTTTIQRLLDDGAATVAGLLAARARQRPDAPAILAPDRPPLSYAALHDRVGALTAALAAAGVGVGDRVALLMPEGPELAVALLAIRATRQ